MIPAPTAAGAAEPGNSARTRIAPPLATEVSPAKIARIRDEEDAGFSLEYDDTRGQKNSMRLDALTYEGAVREARSFLGIGEDNRDPDGDLWDVE